MQKSTKIKVFFIAFLSILFMQQAVYADCTMVDAIVTVTNSTCWANGQIVIEVVPNSATIDMGTIEYALTALQDGVSFNPTPNGGVFQNLPPGLYMPYIRAFCIVENAIVNIQISSGPVRITTSYDDPNMVITSIRKTLNCIPSGMITLAFAGGKAPYTATMTDWDPAYNGPKEFMLQTAGTIEIDDLPEGDYKFELKDDCSTTVTVTGVVGKVASDVPTAAMTLSSTTYPQAVAPAHKGLDIALGQLANTHDLYPYLSSGIAHANKYYEMVLTETATGNTTVANLTSATTGTTGVRASSGLALIDLNYEDLYPAATQSGVTYPAGTAVGGGVTVALRLKACPSVVAPPTIVVINRPTTSTAFTVPHVNTQNYTCAGNDFYVGLITTGRTFCICYPVQAQLINTTTGAVVATNTINSGSSTIFVNAPYSPAGQPYKVEYTGANGAKWASENTYSSLKPTYTGIAVSLNYCPENGKKTSIRMAANGAYGYFIPGTTIEVISAPTGQFVPPVQTVPAGANYNYIYPYSAAMNTIVNENLLPGTYRVRITEPCGSSEEIPVEVSPVNATYTAINHQGNRTGTSNQSYCKRNIDHFFTYFFSAAPHIPGGTHIVFTAGPDGTTNYPEVIWKDVIIPSGYTKNFNPFYFDYTYTGWIPAGPTPGIYTFKVTDGACGNIVYRDITVLGADYISTPLAIDPVYVPCDEGGNVRVYPSGSVGRVGVNSHLATFFRILSAVDENGGAIPTSSYTTGVIQAGGFFEISRNGRYVIQMNPVNSTTSLYCASDTIAFVYKQPVTGVDLRLSSAYICVGAGTGNLCLAGTGGYGTGPYSFEILELNGVPDPSAPPGNQDGIFLNYGAAGDLVKIRITDLSPQSQALNCYGLSYDQTISVLDLQTAKIVFEANAGQICAGDSIQLLCITLGNTSYSWKGSDGFTSTEQHPVIKGADVNMTGWYSVEVTPQHCGDVVRDSVYVTVCPAVKPDLAGDFFELCQHPGTQSFADVTGITPEAGYTARWYHQNGTPIPAGTFETSIVFEEDYYVVYVDDATGCEGPQAEFRIKILHSLPPPNLPVAVAVCYGKTGEFIIPSTTAGNQYQMWETNTATTPLETKTGDGGELNFEVHNITETTTYWFSETDASGGCPTARSSRDITIALSGGAGHIVVPPTAAICSGETETITVTSSFTTPTYKWYDGNTAGATLLHTGDTYITPALHNNTDSDSTYTYYVSVQGDGYCENVPANRAVVDVTVNLPLTPGISTSDENVVCEDKSITLTATGSYTNGETFCWYEIKDPENCLSDVSTLLVTDSGTYNVIVFKNGCPSAPASRRIEKCAPQSTCEPEVVGLEASENTICATQQVTITGSWTGDASYVTITTSGKGVLSSITTTDNPFSIQYTSNEKDAGSILFTVTTEDTTSCASVNDTITITINPKPANPKLKNR